ncbi:MAG: NAD-dependent epimerase/dehydratase family protein [Sandaracinaceae bacterium]
MKVLLVGGAGYIGIPLAERLLERGDEVAIYDRFYFGEERLEAFKSNEGLTLFRGDSRTIEPAIFEGVDAVVQLAALSNDPACEIEEGLSQDINLTGTLRCARLAKQAGVKRYVFSSSCSVYGAGVSGALDEQSPKNPVSLYAKLKIEAESALAEMADGDFVVTALRHATAYGLAPRMRFDLVVNLMTLHAFKNGKIFVLGGGMQWRPLVHVRDIGKAFTLALDAPAEKVQRQAFNVGSDEQNYQIRTIASIVASIVPGATVEVVPDDPDKRSYNTSFKKVHEVLGFTAEYDVDFAVSEIYDALRRGLQDDIRTRTLAYYRHLLDAERLVKSLSIDGKLL